MKKKPDTFDGATGTLVRLIRDSADRRELLQLLRVGVKFARRQHAGGSPGYLRSYITALVVRSELRSFKGLLDELELEAVRRAQSVDGKSLPPIESVNRVWQLVKYHHPKRGEQQATFGTLRNIFTKAKNDNSQAPATDEFS